MLKEELKNIDSSVKELRKFGISVGIVFILIALLFQFIWYNFNVFAILGAIGVLLLSHGLIYPKILLPVHKVWMTFAIILGFIMTRIILSFLFYIVVTLVGLTAKLFRKDFLDRKIDKTQKSYWNYREKIKYTKELTERQF